MAFLFTKPCSLVADTHQNASSFASVFVVKGFKRINLAYRHLSVKEEASGPVLGQRGREGAALLEESTRSEIDAGLQVTSSVTEHTTLDLGTHRPKR